MKFSYTILIMMIGLFCAGPVMRKGEAKKPQISASAILCITSNEAYITANSIAEISRKQDSALSQIQTKINGIKAIITTIKQRQKEDEQAVVPDTCFYAPGYYEQK